MIVLYVIVVLIPAASILGAMSARVLQQYERVVVARRAGRD